MKKGGVRTRDAVPALVYTALGIVIAAFGLGACSRPLEGDGLFVLAAFVAHGVALVVGWLVLHRMSNALQKLALLGMIGLFGSLGAGPGALALSNGWDDSSVREQEARVLGTREHTAKSKTTYYLSLAPWSPLHEPLELTVDAEQYKAAKARGAEAPVRIRVGHGRLGIEHLPLNWGSPYLTFDR